MVYVVSRESSSNEDVNEEEDDGGKNQCDEEDQSEKNDSCIEDSNAISSSAGNKQDQPIETSIYSGKRPAEQDCSNLSAGANK
ncbi:hypothetical protein DAPPUDRAFT_247839 [Daphnia pulex]|uniref:Uncharacterized protein n=1 Tax=Daphnia pulex TaxID=6669 RepID=E9GSZ2_DAPPU|nr:hypothetical protein DAPPUDRAFT_247839 [Daphnia pulex]|eukprot:EFX77277.1 hypothetical protein DAPPUDRAFT_247839 [Daphnia pulex]